MPILLYFQTPLTQFDIVSTKPWKFEHCFKYSYINSCLVQETYLSLQYHQSEQPQQVVEVDLQTNQHYQYLKEKIEIETRCKMKK